MPNSCVRSNSAVRRTRSPGSAGAEAVSGRLDTWARLLQAIMRLYSREGGSPSPVGSEFDGRRWAPAVAGARSLPAALGNFVHQHFGAKAVGTGRDDAHIDHVADLEPRGDDMHRLEDRKSTRLNSSH